MQHKDERAINWRTSSIYIDIDTGELISKKTAEKDYIIINRKKETHVYKTAGTIAYTNECKRTKWKQTKLF